MNTAYDLSSTQSSDMYNNKLHLQYFTLMCHLTWMAQKKGKPRNYEKYILIVYIWRILCIDV